MNRSGGKEPELFIFFCFWSDGNGERSILHQEPLSASTFAHGKSQRNESDNTSPLVSISVKIV